MSEILVLSNCGLSEQQAEGVRFTNVLAAKKSASPGTTATTMTANYTPTAVTSAAAGSEEGTDTEARTAVNRIVSQSTPPKPEADPDP